MKQSPGRMIRKDISKSKGFAKLSPESAVLFCMLIPHFNSHGKMNGEPSFINGEICPRIPYLTIETIPDYLQEITLKTSVKWFQNDGLYFIHSLNFHKEHQTLRKDRMGDDRLPSWESTPVDKAVDKTSSPGQVQDKSRTSPGVVPHEVEVEVEVEDKESPEPFEEDETLLRLNKSMKAIAELFPTFNPYAFQTKKLNGQKRPIECFIDLWERMLEYRKTIDDPWAWAEDVYNKRAPMVEEQLHSSEDKSFNMESVGQIMSKLKGDQS